jgi:hypothetical protein
MFCPSILTVPEVLARAAVTILNVVDFPAPFGPSKPKIYPFFTEKLLSLIARKPLLYFL